MRGVIQILKATLLTTLSITAIVVTFSATSYADTTPPCSSSAVSNCTVAAESGGDCSNLNQCDLIYKYVDPFIAFLTALVGIAVVTSIIIGGIQYSSSAGDPSKASAAKNRIRNAIIALVTFVLLGAMLNFLIPGGLIGG